MAIAVADPPPVTEPIAVAETAPGPLGGLPEASLELPPAGCGDGGGGGGLLGVSSDALLTSSQTDWPSVGSTTSHDGPDTPLLGQVKTFKRVACEVARRQDCRPSPCREY